MDFPKLTVSYDTFQDEENGLVPYLAKAVMMLIREDDIASVQMIMNNIAVVADQLLDLNDEIVVKKEAYDRLMNRMNALQANMAQQVAAQKGLEEEMRMLMGNEEDADDVEEEPADAFGDSLSLDYDPLAALDNALNVDDSPKDEFSALDALTVESVLGESNAPDLSGVSGIVLGDDIDRLAEAEQDELDEEDDIYAEFDIQIEDVDQGYTPVSKALGEEEFEEEEIDENNPENLFLDEEFDEGNDETGGFGDYDDVYNDDFEESGEYDESDFEDSDFEDEDLEEADFNGDFNTGNGKKIGSANGAIAPMDGMMTMPSGVIDMDMF